MKGVGTRVFVRGYMISLTIESECAVLDTVGVASNYGTKVGVICFRVSEISSRVVVSHSDILVVAITVLHEQGGEPSTIRNEFGSDVFCSQSVNGERIDWSGQVRSCRAVLAQGRQDNA